MQSQFFRSPWRSVKVPWRASWRERSLGKNCWFLIRSCPERPRPALDYTHRCYCWGVIIDGTSQSLRYWRGLVHWVCAAVCIQYLQNSAYSITTTCVVAGVSQSIEHMEGSIRKLTLIPWSSVKHSVKHLLLRLAVPGHGVGAQSRSSTVRTHILSDPRKSWVSLG